MVQHQSSAGIDPDPEHMVHHKIGVVQVADDAILVSFIGRLAQQVAGEEQGVCRFCCFESGGQLIASKGSIGLSTPMGNPNQLGSESRRGSGSTENLQVAQGAA